MIHKLAVVTASIDPIRTAEFWCTWRFYAQQDYLGVMVLNGSQWKDAPEVAGFSSVMSFPEVLGPVAAFTRGIEEAAQLGARIVACLHDDLRIEEFGWDTKILRHFDEHPRCGHAGFSGADGLGAEDIYQVPYSPHQLARQGFFSNLLDAEKHGRREEEARRSACADGFSLIGRVGFMRESFKTLEKLGVIHHMYDGAIGALASRLGWETWYLPVRCFHAGGRTAVLSSEYAEWAKQHGGDAGIWERSHEILYEELRDVLPIRVER